MDYKNIKMITREQKIKRIISIAFISVIVSTILVMTSFSATIQVREYLNGRFPAIYSIYLASLGELNAEEMEFIDLLEELPENEQRIYVREVYEKGFSRELLEKLRQWQEIEEKPYLNVAFPSQPEQIIGKSPVYVFGTTDPSSEMRVTVNDKEVERFDPRTGNFLTLVDIPEEVKFPIVVVASRGRVQTSIERSVVYPRIWKEFPLTPLAIHAVHIQPKQDQILREGDELRVIIQGSPEADAVFRIGNNPNEILMEDISGLHGLPTIPGIYMGSYVVKSQDVPLMGDASPQSITVTLRREDKEVSRELPGKVIFSSGLPLRIVKVIGDQNRIYRVREGAFILHGTSLGGDGSPSQLINHNILPGTLMEVVGASGEYLRVNLGTDNYLINRNHVKDIDHVIQKPFTGLSKIQLNENERKVEIFLGTQERFPFLIEDESKQIKLILYGVKISDSIEYEGEASFIQKIKIEPIPEEGPDVVAITIEINEPIMGFDYQWRKKELLISVYKPTVILKDYPLQGRKIVVDPGHGGQYRGAIGPGDIHEKDVVLEIGRFLHSLLEDRGAEVIMTRSEDVHVNLQERIDMAVEHQADIFVSIHANAHAVGADAVNYHGHMTIYNYAHNEKLAEIILDNLVDKIGLPRARLWQRSDLVVLRYPQLPSVLVETAFMMHPEDNWYLLHPVYQREFAQVIMDGIIDYFLFLQE